MKRYRKVLTVLICALFISFSAAAGFAAAVQPDKVTISGTIEKTEAGAVISAADGKFLVSGTEIAPEMVGKKVNATGTISEEGGEKVLKVERIEEVQ